MAVTELEIKKAEAILGRSFRMKACEVCGENYYCARESSRVCSNRCRQQAYLARRSKTTAEEEDLSDHEQKLIDKIKESKIKHS